jgi:NADH-quinone oxidoreductase subunit I
MQKGANNTYWGNIKEGIKTSLKGLSLSFKHFKDARQSRKPIFVDDPTYFNQQTGIVTTQYPFEQIPVPDNGRYQLHNEMDDCIVCDKCAKICPVDCIEIEPIKATGVVGYASDGSAIRLYAAKFDIDMSKCCFCGLCTTVCPTECLTMKKEYDFSVFDIIEHNFEFGNLTPEQSEEKKKLYEQYMLEKEAFKKEASKQKAVTASDDTVAKPVAKPAFKPKASVTPVTDKSVGATDEQATAKPVFKPKIRPTATADEGENTSTLPTEEAKVSAKPVFKPKFKPANAESVEAKSEETNDAVSSPEPAVEPTPRPKPVFKPKFKPANAESVEAKSEETNDAVASPEPAVEPAPRPKPVFKPKFKPANAESVEAKSEETNDAVASPEPAVEPTPRPKPVFKPKFKKPE